MDHVERRTLERWSDRSMPGSERHRIGGWVLRADRGATGRANSVWPAEGPDRPIADAVGVVERWYEARRRRPTFQLFDGAPVALVAELDRRRYLDVAGALVMTTSVGPAAAAPTPSDGWEVRTTPAPSSAFVELVGDERRVAEMATTALTQRYVTIHQPGGVTLGGGLGTLDEAGFGIFAMHTVERARRRGVAGAVLAELRNEATSLGATTSWLQVMADNIGARRLYERHGMAVVHRYRYRASPPHI